MRPTTSRVWIAKSAALEVDDEGNPLWRVDISGNTDDNKVVRRLTPTTFLLDDDADNKLRLLKFYDGVTTADADGNYKADFFENDFVYDNGNYYRFIGEDGSTFYFNNTAPDVDDPADSLEADYTDSGQLGSDYFV